ncbi:Sybindin-like protein [Ephemerocybe angulata]|uniref:Trafficking protein particle complex subunit n=1 Tax=Ephemerocybe angulata TaxID=980116 RepID=A0A8H6ICC9_9AGAR|nr:Sybindin-like protein [Tulosesus angulatus]
MTINSLYIFDRHCICVYYQDWHRTRRPKPASEAGLLPCRTVVAISNELPPPPPSTAGAGVGGLTSTGLAFDEEAKNMVKKISGRDEQFTSYRTSAYRLHLFETLSGYKFVMLTDPKTENMRVQLRRIYEGPFLEFVVRNPLVKMDSREQGIDNENFRAALDRMVRGLPVYA